jgi:hypothetical protein
MPHRPQGPSLPALVASPDLVRGVPPRVLYQLEQAGKLAADVLDEWVREWTREGKTQEWIAGELGCTRQAISKRQARLGVQSDDPRRLNSLSNPVAQTPVSGDSESELPPDVEGSASDVSASTSPEPAAAICSRLKGRQKQPCQDPALPGRSYCARCTATSSSRGTRRSAVGSRRGVASTSARSWRSSAGRASTRGKRSGRSTPRLATALTPRGSSRERRERRKGAVGEREVVAVLRVPAGPTPAAPATAARRPDGATSPAVRPVSSGRCAGRSA